MMNNGKRSNPYYLTPNQAVLVDPLLKIEKCLKGYYGYCEPVLDGRIYRNDIQVLLLVGVD